MKWNDNSASADIRMLEDIKKHVEDSRWQIRASAARLLPVLGYKAPLDLLKRLLGDGNQHVRIAALEACVPLAYRLPVELVMRFLDDNEWAVRSAAAWALGFYGIHIPAERLLTIVNTTKEDCSVRASALISLGKVRNGSYRERIIGALHDPEWELREAAIQALEDESGDLPDALFIELLQHDSAPEVRAAALRFVGRYEEHLPLVWQALDDEELVCRAAIELLKASGERVRAELIGLLLFLPADSTLGTWIQEELELVDGGEEQEREISFVQLKEFLHPTLYRPGGPGSYPSHPAMVLIGHILTQRTTLEWHRYIDAVEELLFHPREYMQHLASVHYAYSLLLERIGQVLQEQVPNLKLLQQQWVLAGLTFDIAGAIVTVRWHPQNATYMVRAPTASFQQGKTEHVPVHVRLHFSVWDDERQRLCSLSAPTVLSGYTADGRQLYQSLLTWVRQQNGFVQQQYEQIAKSDDSY